MIRKGEKFIYDITGQEVTVADRGHYPDTIIVELPSDGPNNVSLKVEVYLRHLTALAAGAILSGCLASMPTDSSANQPEPYRQGLYDGCVSGKAATGNWTYRFRQDPQRMSSDSMYKTGWDAGFVQCKTESEQLNAIIRGR
jgi:hypothetical protein